MKRLKSSSRRGHPRWIVSALDQDYDCSPPLEEELGDGEVDARWDDADPLEPAFERFYREHYAFVWRSARRLLVGAGDDRIEDVIQETWIAAYRRFDSYAGECLPTTWLFGILRNVVRNHERGERRHHRRVAAFVAHEQERERGRESGEALRLLGPKLLEGFLRTLDDDKRAVFVLAELEGHSGREIAEALSINANTAHSRLRAARQQFCAYFDLPPSREQLAGRVRSLRERPEQPPAQALARSRALLIVGLGKSSLVAGGSAGLGVAVVAKIAAAIGALLVAGAGLIAVERAQEGESPIAVTNEVEPLRGREHDRVEAAIGELVGVEQLDESIDSIGELAPIPVSASIPPAVQRSKVARPDAYELLRQARKALVESQPAQALELLANIPASSSTLRGERVATEVAALCRLDRGSEARRVVERFAKAEPDSPLLARLASACW